MIIEQTQPTLLAPGWYPAIVLDVQRAEGEYGEQLEFTLLVDGPDGKSKKLRAWARAQFSPLSKLYAWAEAIFGRAIPPDYNLDTEHLKGRPVDIRLERKSGQRGEFTKVVDMARAGSMTQALETDDLPF